MDKAQWRSIEAFNNVNKHTGHGLLAVLAPRIQFALVIISTDGTTWQFVHSAAVIILNRTYLMNIFERSHVRTLSRSHSGIYCVHIPTSLIV